MIQAMTAAHPLSDDRLCLVHHTDCCQLQRYIQSSIGFHCGSPSLQGPMRWTRRSLTFWCSDNCIRRN